MYPVIPKAAVDMGLQEDLKSHGEALVSQKKIVCSGALVSLCSLKGMEILLPRRKLSGCGVHAFNFGLLIKFLASQSYIVTLLSALWALEVGPPVALHSLSALLPKPPTAVCELES